MNTLSLPVRCTREEYMTFCAMRRKDPLWTTIAGVVLLLIAAVLCILDQSVGQPALLLLLLGVVLLLTSPLILPTVRKGAAGRRYDASDSLKAAVSITMNEETLTVRSACQEGTVPLSALTAVEQTGGMTALVFGKELTVCIPMRSFTEAEAAAFEAILAIYKKEQ